MGGFCQQPAETDRFLAAMALQIVGLEGLSGSLCALSHPKTNINRAYDLCAKNTITSWSVQSGRVSV